MARPERLEGRDGQIWTAYVSGATQEVIAAEHGISRQRVGQVLDEVRETIGDTARMDAALLAQERTDALLAAVWPAAMDGDPRAVGAALRVLERQAKALGTDAVEPVTVTFERHLDEQGQALADAVAAALEVLGLDEERRQLALRAAVARLSGEVLPAPVPVVEDSPDVRAGMEATLRGLVADEGVDVDALLREVDGDG